MYKMEKVRKSIKQNHLHFEIFGQFRYWVIFANHRTLIIHWLLSYYDICLWQKLQKHRKA